MRDISLNGIDGTGKSTQVRLLSSESGHFHTTQPLTSYSPEWQRYSGHAFYQWWFDEVSSERLCDLVIKSLNKRHRDEGGLDFRILDRGVGMYMAVCVASISIKEGIVLAEAIKFTNEAFCKSLSFDPDELAILLLPSVPYFQSVNYLTRLIDPRKKEQYSDASNLVYERYQTLLVDAMDYYLVQRGAISLVVDRPICDIQNEIRAILSTVLGQEIAPIGRTIKRLIGFGGLSESGKSSFAESFRVNRGYYRLKLNYFSVDSNAMLNDLLAAEKTALELLRFFNSHYFVEQATIESLHGYVLPALLKLMLGGRFKVVFMEAPIEVRTRRRASSRSGGRVISPDDLDRRDREKIDRGIENIRSIADLIFDNSKDGLECNLKTFLEKIDERSFETA